MAELEEMGLSRGEAQVAAKDRTPWRNIVVVVCPTGDEEEKKRRTLSCLSYTRLKNTQTRHIPCLFPLRVASPFLKKRQLTGDNEDK